jgi:cytochrome P450
VAAIRRLRASLEVSVTDLPRLDPDSASLAELGAARERSWVAISDRGFEVLRYAEGSALLRDRRFQKGGSFRWRLDRLGIDDGPVRASWNRMLVTNEGDERTHLRLPLSRLLGVRRTGGLSETTREIVSGVLEEAPVTGEIDFMEHFAWKIAPRVYCRLFSAPLEEAPTAARLSDSTLSPILTMDRSRRQESIDAYLESLDFVRRHIDRRRGDLRDDFTSALIREQEQGNITETELVEIGISLLQASIDNTAHQIGLTLGTLLEDRARWQRLVSEPALIPGAIEEVIRLRPRFGTIFRLALDDLELNGLPVAAGTAVFVSVRAGQRDPRVFSDPDSFDPQREPVRQLMFGNGPYSCLGQHLARLEIQDLLAAMVERYPDAHLSTPWSARDYSAITEVTSLRGALR